MSNGVMSNAQNLHALLDQTSWIHALAKSLVADPHLAADLAQDTTVKALEHQPDGRSPLRGWLATVMRNNLIKHKRGDRNRSAREQALRHSELSPSAHDVVERAETHRNVVLAVLALDEPYRSTLLMRFFEQLSYDEIARRTGVTNAAVNSRVTRGLAELRLALENTYGGDRRALCLALAPLAKLPTGVAATTILGVKTMHIAIGTAAAALVAVTASVGLMSDARETRATALPPEPEPVAAQPIHSTQAAIEFAPSAASEEAPLLASTQQREKHHDDQDKKVDDKDKKADDARVWKAELFQTMPLAATVRGLSLNTGAGDVEVTESLSNQLEITARVRAQLGKVRDADLTQIFEDHVEITTEEGGLKIEDNHKNDEGWSVSFLIGVPGKLSITANTGSGDVTIRRAGGRVGANTGSGDVKIALLQERVMAIMANTGSGDVEVEVGAVEKRLGANTGSGDLVMFVADALSPGESALTSGSGDVRLIVPASVVASFDLETNGDGIEMPPALRIPVDKSVPGRARAKGSIGSGGGRYTLRSGSGELRVEFGNALPPRQKD